MDEQALTAAAEQVDGMHDSAGAALPRLAGLDTLEDGYRVQQRANAGLERHAGRRASATRSAAPPRPCGATSTCPSRWPARSSRTSVHPDGATVARAGFVRLGIETEIAVRLADDLPPRTDAYTRADVADAVAEVMAAIELVDDRYADFATHRRSDPIADNAFDAGSVLGAPAPGWRGLDLAALTARTWQDGRLLAEGLQRRAARPPAGRTGLARQLPLEAWAWA